MTIKDKNTIVQPLHADVQMQACQVDYVSKSCQRVAGLMNDPGRRATCERETAVMDFQTVQRTTGSVQLAVERGRRDPLTQRWSYYCSRRDHRVRKGTECLHSLGVNASQIA